MKALRWMWFAAVWVGMSGMMSVAAQARTYTLFYMDDSQAAKTSFEAHAAKIDVLVPTWYTVDADGLVGGGPDALVMRAAQANKVDVMPIVALFDPVAFHRLATNAAAQAEMNAAMVRECRAHGYTGFQFDFEHIDWTDRDLLSEMVARSAQAMHAAGLKLTIATVPNAPGYVTSKDGRDGFESWIFREWRGAYDLAALSKSADLICLMTYDQHTRWTMPGPVAGWVWTEENLKYALKVVPKEKLLLGIPLYGSHWYTQAPTVTPSSETPNEAGDEISTAAVMALAEEYNGGRVSWDAEDHTPYFYFYREQMREWVYFTNARAFEDRVKLAEQSGVKGICAWVLGDEDPAIWQELPDRTSAGQQ